MTKFIIISLLVLISISIFMALEPSIEGLDNYVLKDVIKCEEDGTAANTIVRATSSAGILDTNCQTILNSARSMPQGHFKDTHDQIKQDHDDIIRMRADIDRDLKEISKGEDTIYAEKRLNYEKTLYSTLMFTILASSLIYFVFNEL